MLLLQRFWVMFGVALSAIAVGLIAPPSPSQASAIFLGSGTGTNGQAIAGQAEFDFVQHNFGAGNVDAVQITLTNTASVTQQRGNLLTGVFWTLSGSIGALPTTSTGFDGRATTVVLDRNGATATNVDIAPAVNNTATDGTFQLSNGPFGIANNGGNFSAFKYGIATVGYGLTGFNGNALSAGAGQDDYGIFAHGSPMPLSSNLFPLIDASAMFWIARPPAWASLAQLGDNVRLAYGSLPDNILAATSADPPTTVPEPGALLLWGSGLVGLGAWRWRKAVLAGARQR